jgi:hypothetical protein
MYIYIGHVFHLVHSTGPASLNAHLFVHISKSEFIVINFHEIHCKMSGMLS